MPTADGNAGERGASVGAVTLSQIGPYKLGKKIGCVARSFASMHACVRVCLHLALRLPRVRSNLLHSTCSHNAIAYSHSNQLVAISCAHRRAHLTPSCRYHPLCFRPTAVSPLFHLVISCLRSLDVLVAQSQPS
jgi:hypothetical protein